MPCMWGLCSLTNRNYEEIIRRLREPFNGREIEWKIQVTSQDKQRGMAVAYMDARAVQKRLDETVGPFKWKGYGWRLKPAGNPL